MIVVYLCFQSLNHRGFNYVGKPEGNSILKCFSFVNYTFINASYFKSGKMFVACCIFIISDSQTWSSCGAVFNTYLSA